MKIISEGPENLITSETHGPVPDPLCISHAILKTEQAAVRGNLVSTHSNNEIPPLEYYYQLSYTTL